MPWFQMGAIIPLQHRKTEGSLSGSANAPATDCAEICSVLLCCVNTHTCTSSTPTHACLWAARQHDQRMRRVFIEVSVWVFEYQLNLLFVYRNQHSGVHYVLCLCEVSEKIWKRKLQLTIIWCREQNLHGVQVTQWDWKVARAGCFYPYRQSDMKFADDQFPVTFTTTLLNIVRYRDHKSGSFGQQISCILHKKLRHTHATSAVQRNMCKI